jgi:hypothetical protein
MDMECRGAGRAHSSEKSALNCASISIPCLMRYPPSNCQGCSVSIASDFHSAVYGADTGGGLAVHL